MELGTEVIKGLISQAQAAMGNAYAPYSGFPVGAALLCKSGTVYRGSNIENAAYGAGICAERAAVASAVSNGERGFTAIAVACGTESLCSPCGICRQVIMEFGKDILVIRTNPAGDYDINPISHWLPGAFTSAELV